MAGPPSARPRVVIVGGGFGGLEAVRALKRSPVDIVLIDRQNHHCFQPLLYQVATATLNPSDIAWPIRSILRDQPNVRVVMAEVTGVDTAANAVITDRGEFAFDYLVIATGATHTYFGHDDWAAHAPGLKWIEDATEIRRRVLTAFETAELSPSDAVRQGLITFAVVGGGPTGVEMAGAIADMAHKALPRDFRTVDPARARILLIEAGPRILPAFPEAQSRYAKRALERMGVEVLTGRAVSAISEGSVTVGEEIIPAGAVVWAAGVKASPAAAWLGAPRDKVGRVEVEADLSAPGHPNIFVVGDTAAVPWSDGRLVPGVAPAAKQMGHYVGGLIAGRVSGRKDPGAFAYKHAGDLATVGRRAAIVKMGAVVLSGLIGWLVWGVAHIYFLIGARNRIAVSFNWLWEYLTFGRRARLITRPAAERLDRG
jgi:NADH dehydrogenase